MTSDPQFSSGTSDEDLDLLTSLFGGTVHEVGGLLFALRIRLDAIAPQLPEGHSDVEALQDGIAAIQAVLDGLRLFTARPTATSTVRERPIDGSTWWHRTSRLARYLIPRTVEVTGTAIEGITLTGLDLGRLTGAALLLLTHASAPTGVRTLATDLGVARSPDRLRFTVRVIRETDGPADGPDRDRSRLARARKLIKPVGGLVRVPGVVPGEAFELTMPLAEAIGDA